MPLALDRKSGQDLWVVMATYNGAAFLREQLQSLDRQQLRPAGIIVRDDGSTDDTLAILHEFADTTRLALDIDVNARRLGAARNFLTALRVVPENAAYVAFADQDDVWEPWKLARAVSWLRRVPPDRPAFYASRLCLIDAKGNRIGLSPAWPRPPAFANALVENIATGCTMVLNHAAFRLLRQAGAPDVVYHDWWAYLLVTGAGGAVLFDTRPGILYRQHGGNVTGAPATLVQSAFRRVMRLGVKKNTTRDVLFRNLEAAYAAREMLQPENAQIVQELRAARTAGPRERFALLRQAGVYRQFPLDNRIIKLLLALGVLPM